MHRLCHGEPMRYEAETLAGCVRLARFIHGDESRKETAAGASRYLYKDISRDYIRRIEEPDQRAGLDEETVDPLVVRALAAHFSMPVEELSPRVAERLAKAGISAEATPVVDLRTGSFSTLNDPDHPGHTSHLAPAA